VRLEVGGRLRPIVHRLAFLRGILRPAWLRVALPIWGVLTFYDTLSSQILPEHLARQAPKLREIVATTSGYLPLGAWLLILAAMLTIASLEYAFRLSRRGAIENPLQMEFHPERHIFRLVQNAEEFLVFSVELINCSDETIRTLSIDVHGDWSGLFAGPNIAFDHVHGRFHEPNITSCDLHPRSAMPVTLFVVPKNKVEHKLRSFTLRVTAMDMKPVSENFCFDDRRTPAMFRCPPN
jgi:hypothetical protein